MAGEIAMLGAGLVADAVKSFARGLTVYLEEVDAPAGQLVSGRARLGGISDQQVEISRLISVERRTSDKQIGPEPPACGDIGAKLEQFVDPAAHVADPEHAVADIIVASASPTGPIAATWACMSHRPGTRYFPATSILRMPGGARRPRPTATIRSPAIRTSARRGGASEAGSTTRPPTRSRPAGWDAGASAIRSGVQAAEQEDQERPDQQAARSQRHTCLPRRPLLILPSCLARPLRRPRTPASRRRPS